jgi:hypothetical protein
MPTFFRSPQFKNTARVKKFFLLFLLLSYKLTLPKYKIISKTYVVLKVSSTWNFLFTRQSDTRYFSLIISNSLIFTSYWHLVTVIYLGWSPSIYVQINNNVHNSLP